ncbi:MAG: site-specific integrase, partial [Asticcacaulis sp.]|uniref:site-specific integrase n=1 Tax=Asticcacaulis sp. TaxID=1872648 RepID=UPI0025BBC956
MRPDPLTAFFEMLSVERNASPRTREAYGQDLLDLRNHAGVDADGLLTLGEGDIAGFFAALDARGLASS